MEKRYKFSTVNSAKDNKITLKTSLEITLACIMAGAACEEYRRGKREKAMLPGVCWAAEFVDGVRHLASAKPSGLAYLDIDHIAENREGVIEYYNEKILGREVDLQIVHAQISPSHTGLHIVFVPDADVHISENLKEAQARFAEAAGIDTYDANCNDLSRILFLSGIADTLFNTTDCIYE